MAQRLRLTFAVAAVACAYWLVLGAFQGAQGFWGFAVGFCPSFGAMCAVNAIWPPR